MKKTIFIGIFVFVLMGLFPQAQYSQDLDAVVYVVHGLPGADLGLDPALPIDVSIDGVCTYQDIRFGDILGPITKPAGTYSLGIGLANPANPCSLEMYKVDVTLVAGENKTLVIHMDEQGAPTAREFANDFSKIKNKKARIIMHHTAVAPAIDVSLVRVTGKNPYMVGVDNFISGDRFLVEILTKRWRLECFLPEMAEPFFSKKIKFKSWSAYLIFAVGSVDTGTFQILTKRVSGLKPILQE